MTARPSWARSIPHGLAVRQEQRGAGLSRIFPGRAPRTALKRPQTQGEKVSGLCRNACGTFPPRIPPPLQTPGPCSARAGNGPRRKAAARAICGPPRPRGVQSATGSSVRGCAAPQLASRGRLPALSPVPRAPRPNAARPTGLSLRPLRPLRLRGLRAHRFRAWGPGCGACRRGRALADLRSRLRRPHPGSPSIGICALRPWPSGTAHPPLAPSPAYRGAWGTASVFLPPDLPRSGAGSPERRRLRRLRRAARGRARRAAQARRAFGWMHGRAGAERAAGRRAGHPLRPAPLAPLAGGPSGLVWGLSSWARRARPAVAEPVAFPESQAKRSRHNPRRLRLRTPPGMYRPVCPRPRRRAMRPPGAVLPPPSSAPKTGPQRPAAQRLFATFRHRKTPVSRRCRTEMGAQRFPPEISAGKAG